MEIIYQTTGSGVVSMVATVDDYDKMFKDLLDQAHSMNSKIGAECFVRLSESRSLISSCKEGSTDFDFCVEEKIKSCFYATKDWLVTKSSSKTVFDVLHTLYQWKLKKYKHRAWDISMTADDCEGMLIRLMERVSESQNIAVIQVFLSIQELESSVDSAVRIQTRVEDAIVKLSDMVRENIPLVGVTKSN